MKKNTFVRAILAVLSAAVMLLSFTACGKNAVIGSYKLIGLGDDVGVDELEKSGVEMSIEVKDDNTYVLNLDANNSSDGTWEEDGDNLKFISNGNELKGTFKDGKLTLENDGKKMIFEKE